MSANFDPLFLEIVSLIRDIVTVITAIIVAVVAIIGLRTWKKQIVGQSQHKIARELMRSIYDLRDYFRNCRGPKSTGLIFTLFTLDRKEYDLKDEWYSYKYQSEIYSPIQTMLSNLVGKIYENSLEANVVLNENAGNELDKNLATIYDLKLTYDNAVRKFLSLFIGQPSIKKSPPDLNLRNMDKTERAIMETVMLDLSPSFSEPQNLFTVEINEIIKQYENLLHPYMFLKIKKEK